MQSIEETRNQILARTPILSTEEIALLEAGGRVFRETIYAPHDFPSFDYSAMDGYAVRFEDLAQASEDNPVRLKVAGEVAASGWNESEMSSGEAFRIFTGAAIPPGADAVVMQEKVSREGDWAIFTAPTPLGNSIRKQGEDLEKGQLLLGPHHVLGSGEVGLLASIGRGMVRVSRRPRVAILACGDELVPLHETPRPGQIRESNRYTLATQIRENGGVPILLPLVPDDPAQIQEQIRAGLKADILVTSGGVSVGDHDWVRPALEAEGVELHLWRVAVKPGKPLVFGTSGSTLVLGLPGNPASSMVTFEIFVRPALRKMLGLKDVFYQTLRVPLTAPARGTRGRTHFVRGQLHKTEAGFGFAPLPSQSSGNLLSLRGIQALGILPPGAKRFESGQEVEVMPLEGAWSGAETPFSETRR